MLICLVLCLQSCYKDLGNYDLVDYNSTVISGAVGRTIVLGDTLRYSPTIQWKYPERDTTTAFTFEWRQGETVVSTERDLVYIPQGTGLTVLHFYVTEAATDIVSRFAFSLTVNSPYRNGWLMLTNNNDQSDLHFLRRTQQTVGGVAQVNYTLYENTYSTMYSGSSLGTGAKKLLTRVFSSYDNDEVLVIQDDEPVFLSGSDFSKLVLLRQEFSGGSIPNESKVVDYVDGGSANFVILENGELYWKRNSASPTGLHEGQFIDIPVYFEGGGTNLAAFIESNTRSNFVYMYDTGNNRFASIYSPNTGVNNWVGRRLTFVDMTAPPTGFVSLTNMAGYKLLYSKDYANSTYYVNIIKNENTGEYLYQTYGVVQNFATGQLRITAHQQEVFAASNYVSDNTVYCRTYNNSYLFFGEGSRLYFYDVNTKQVKLYKDFGAGRITHLALNGTESELGVVINDGSLHVCSTNNLILGQNNPGETGILYETRDLGEIVDLKWKWGGFWDHYFGW